MFTKLMTIPDALIPRYYELLTDVLPAEIAQIQADIAGEKLHPMQAKRDLARTITADFHSQAEAAHAEENWSRQFQQGGVSDDIEEIGIAQSEIAAPPTETQALLIRVPKLLVHLGLVSSNAEGTRKLAEGAVKIEGETHKELVYPLADLPTTLTVRLGKKAKRALLT
jgi:tyrosyl-tRNA synthetase